MSDSIIVYRNPLEKTFWEGTMGGNGNTLLFIIVFIVVAILSWVLSYHIFQWLANRMGCKPDNSNAFCGLLATIIAGVLAFWAGYHVL